MIAGVGTEGGAPGRRPVEKRPLYTADAPFHDIYTSRLATSTPPHASTASHSSHTRFETPRYKDWPGSKPTAPALNESAVDPSTVDEPLREGEQAEAASAATPLPPHLFLALSLATAIDPARGDEAARPGRLEAPAGVETVDGATPLLSADDAMTLGNPETTAGSRQTPTDAVTAPAHPTGREFSSGEHQTAAGAGGVSQAALPAGEHPEAGRSTRPLHAGDASAGAAQAATGRDATTELPPGLVAPRRGVNVTTTGRSHSANPRATSGATPSERVAPRFQEPPTMNGTIEAHPGGDGSGVGSPGADRGAEVSGWLTRSDSLKAPPRLELPTEPSASPSGQAALKDAPGAMRGLPRSEAAGARDARGAQDTMNVRNDFDPLGNGTFGASDSPRGMEGAQRATGGAPAFGEGVLGNAGEKGAERLGRSAPGHAGRDTMVGDPGALREAGGNPAAHGPGVHLESEATKGSLPPPDVGGESDPAGAPGRTVDELPSRVESPPVPPLASGAVTESVAASGVSESRETVPVFARPVAAGLEQMVKAATVHVDGDLSEIRLQLQPQRLGDLELHLTVERGVVAAHFIAQSEEVRALIESSLADLERHLTEQGAADVSLSVSVGGERAHDGRQAHSDPVRERVRAPTRKAVGNAARPAPVNEGLRAWGLAVNFDVLA